MSALLAFLLTILCGLVVYIWQDTRRQFKMEMKGITAEVTEVGKQLRLSNVHSYNFMQTMFSLLCDLSPEKKLLINQAAARYYAERDKPNGKGAHA